MRHIIPISGKDSLATAIVQQAYKPQAYEFVFNDTFVELPETYQWLNRIETYLGFPILRHGRNLNDIISCEGILPSPRVRFCTRKAKIEPMEGMLASGDEATIYFGIRADEQGRAGYQQGRKDITLHYRYPLIEHGIGLSGVWRLLELKGLPPPSFFWQAIYQEVQAALLFPDLLERLQLWERTRLFSWRSRSNCYFCFFQRQYEWIGLLDHHPGLFWQAAEIEESTTQAIAGRDNRRSKMWTWRGDGSLRELAARADEIRAKRVRAIINDIYGSTMNPQDRDELDIVSCGLFCGK